ncbi:BCCT family transporter [Dasania marina]|uniref:BCCT family transporter n=1 Tax=Dasania marina TaxID=471499 RepID=UPI0030D85CC9|tara:strand:+ start:57178 stop:58773 length:1596 start_codon:yes stop_codon:yes gene_type:complete
MQKLRVDRVLFGVAVTLIVTICLPLGLMPEKSNLFISEFYSWISNNLSVFYQLFGIFTIIYLAWLALSRHGHIRLSQTNEKPEFSNFAWGGMLFCAGTGASLLVWAGIEWTGYYIAPPFGIEPRSTQAIEIASAYGPFHWGITAWCFYALPTIAIAYPFYTKGIPYLRASTALHSILGPNAANSVTGRLVDLLAMLALLGGAGSSLGMIAPTIAACVAELLGIETSFTLQLVIMLVCIALFSASVYMGIGKGIKRLSELNVILSLVLLTFILVAGPTLFILKSSLNTVGVMAENFIRMMTWTDPVEKTGFVETWTVFYWAWWIAFAPPIGVFVTRISRGRTIRQVVLSMILFGTLGSWAFYFVIGNYSLSLELNSIMSVTESKVANGMYVTIANIFATLPFSSLVLVVFTLVCIISVATTYDSASYTLASTATKELTAGSSPARWHRLFWAGILGILPILMMYVGGLEIIRSGFLIASFPLLFVGVAMVVALTKSLNEIPIRAASNLAGIHPNSNAKPAIQYREDNISGGQ